MSLAGIRQSKCGSRLVLVVSLAVIAAAMIVLVDSTAAPLLAADEKQDAAAEPIEGRLWNLADKPFTFRLRRRDGVAWGDPITVEPGKYFAVKVNADTRSELEGITGKGTGHVSIEYAELGGKIRLQLPAQNNNNDLVPFWFHVKDANGFSRLVQAKDVEDAKKQQTILQQEPKLTPQELARIKQMLKANWVLFD